jgi:hypothetical protein
VANNNKVALVVGTHGERCLAFDQGKENALEATAAEAAARIRKEVNGWGFSLNQGSRNNQCNAVSPAGFSHFR